MDAFCNSKAPLVPIGLADLERAFGRKRFSEPIWTVATLALAALLGWLAPPGAQARGKPQPPPPPPPPVVGCVGDFPALAYLEQTRDRKGRPLTYSLIVTNASADPDCRVVVYSRPGDRYLSSLSFTRNVNGSFRLAWQHPGDPDLPGVLVADFTVGSPDSNGVVSINDSIPLQPKEVFRYQGSYTRHGTVGIDAQGNHLVFDFSEGSIGGPYFYGTYYIDDVDGCVAQAATTPVGESCAEPITTTSDNTGWLVVPSFSDDGSRVYYGSYTPGHPDPGRTYTSNLSFVEGRPGNWSVPQIVMTELDLEPVNGVYGEIDRPRFGMLDGRPSLAFHLDSNLHPDFDSLRFVALDGPMGQCLTGSGTDSCVATGSAEPMEERWVPSVRYFFRWWSSKLLVLRSGSIYSWDPATNQETTIVSSGSIYEFDPVE